MARLLACRRADAVPHGRDPDAAADRPAVVQGVGPADGFVVQRPDGLQCFDEADLVTDRRAGREHRARAQRVPQAHLDWMHPERLCGLVEQRLEGERGLGRAEAAHRAAEDLVGVDTAAAERQVGDVVRPAARHGGPDDDHRAGRRVRPAVSEHLHLQAGHAAVAVRAERRVDLERVPLGRRRE